MTVQDLLYSCLILALTVVGFLTQTWLKALAAELKGIAKTLNEIKESIITHEKDIEYIKIEQANMKSRLDSHGHKINHLENKLNSKN